MTLHANAAPEASFPGFISLCLFSVFCNLSYPRNLCDFQYNDLSQGSYHLDIFFLFGFLFLLSVPLFSFINSQLHSCVSLFLSLSFLPFLCPIFFLLCVKTSSLYVCCIDVKYVLNMIKIDRNMSEFYCILCKIHIILTLVFLLVLLCESTPLFFLIFAYFEALATSTASMCKRVIVW